MSVIEDPCTATGRARRQPSGSRRRTALAVAGIWCGSLLLPLGAAAQGGGEVGPARTGGGGVIVATEIRGPITPVVADHIEETVRRANQDGSRMVVVEMDTPGGLDTAMRQIIQSFLGSRIPVVVSIEPPGARAASAGAFIALSAHIVSMAPGTTIGAATPVDLGGGEIGEKIVADAASFAEALAELRGRDEEFAVAMVREGRSITFEEAQRIGIADLIASDRDTLLAALHGREVEISETVGTVRIETEGVPVVEQRMGSFRQFLQWLADPNLAFLFMSLGTLAIIYELANPGMGIGGILGVIMLLLAFFALAVLPANAVGVALLLLGIGLLIAEIFTPGMGVFAGGGTIAFLLGGIFLFRGDLGISVSLQVLVPIVVVVGLGATLLGRFAWRTRSVPQSTGAAQVVGKSTTIRRVVGDGTGMVFIEGAWWRCRPRDGGRLRKGRRVAIVDMEGLELVVEPQEEGS